MKKLKLFLKNIITVTPFKITFSVVTFFIVVSFLNDVSTTGLPLISTLEYKALDFKFQMRGPRKVENKIIVVGIDEKSLQTLGQWPFDRAKVIAPVLEKLCSYGVLGIGTDVMWPESEKAMSSVFQTEMRSLARGAGVEPQYEELLQTMSGDAQMKKAAEFCGSKLVYGYTLTSTEPEITNPEVKKDYEARLSNLLKINRVSFVAKTPDVIIPKSEQDFNNPAFPNTDFQLFRMGAILNSSTVTPENTEQGYFNNEAEDDGNYRHYLPVQALKDNILPSLALKLAMKGIAATHENKEPQINVMIPSMDSGKSFTLKLKAGNEQIIIPANKSGRMLVNYYGPNMMFPYVSLSDVLSNEDTISYQTSYEAHVLNGGNPNEPPKPQTYLKKNLFKDAIILIGSTAFGLHDLRPRPFDSNAFGVENHATAIDNIMGGNYLEKPNAETLFILLGVLYILGLLYGVAIARLSAKPGFLFAFVTMGSILYVDQVYLFNQHGIVFAGHLQAIQFLFQYLAVTILKYVKEENDKKFIRQAFDKFVSPAVIEQMLSDPSKLRIGGDKKELTILFSDVAGFTELSEKLDTKVLTLFLNEYLGAMTDIVQANQGTLDKYIGDAVMAFWGAPIDNPKHAQMAVKTAIEMQKKIIELNVIFKQKYGFEIEARIGLNSGEVSVGNFGSSKVFEYTVIGDNVNLASRLEGVNKYYGTHILISESTLNLLGDHNFLMREIDTIKVKGKAKAVKIFEVIHEEAAGTIKEMLLKFKEGLSHYYARHWDQAIESFTSVMSKFNKNDYASNEFIERCKYYKDHPPTEDWDGSWEMKSK